MNKIVVPGTASGEVLAFAEGISFWGGVDAQTGLVQDAHHPQHGESLVGKIVLMPTSRGSCSGSGVLLELALNGHAPAAIVFHEAEDILTLGAVIAAHMFERPVVVVKLDRHSYDRLAVQSRASIDGDSITAQGLHIELHRLDTSVLELSPADRAMLDGETGEASQLAMEVLRIMATAAGASKLIDVTRVHIDGCIYAGPANLSFASGMLDRGARVKVPTTLNAISVEMGNWQAQGVPPEFGTPASALAEAYVSMGARPTFTCAPYLEEGRPVAGEDIGWSESNAVIFANSVLGAHTVKHPDFLDLFVALTGRAPLCGVYLREHRQAQVRLVIELPDTFDESIWPLIGWVAGQQSPDRIPRLEGLDDVAITEDDLKALCASFGTTSAAPMLHIQGVTPEGDRDAQPGAGLIPITRDMLASAWRALDSGPEEVDLVALGSPHFSLSETRRFTGLMRGHDVVPGVHCIITLGRDTLAAAEQEGLIGSLQESGVQVLRDLCWCSITEPVFPPGARHLVTNSGKYAHYAPGLCSRSVRLASLDNCARAAREGSLATGLPAWLE